MDIFESLENLQVSEACFEDIINKIQEAVRDKNIDSIPDNEPVAMSWDNKDGTYKVVTFKNKKSGLNDEGTNQHLDNKTFKSRKAAANYAFKKGYHVNEELFKNIISTVEEYIQEFFKYNSGDLEQCNKDLADVNSKIDKAVEGIPMKNGEPDKDSEQFKNYVNLLNNRTSIEKSQKDISNHLAAHRAKREAYQANKAQIDNEFDEHQNKLNKQYAQEYKRAKKAHY